MNDNHRCATTENGHACQRAVIHAAPVPLCDAHRIEIALALVPDLLRGSLITATIEAKTPPRLDLVEHAAAVDHENLLAVDVHDPVVYFVANGGRVKIGYTTNLAGRLAMLTLRADNVLLTLAGGPELERALHARFAAHRQGNTEWFDMAPELFRFIARRPDAPSAPKPPRVKPRPDPHQPAKTTPRGGAFERHVASARAWLAEDPTLSGSQIGRKLGKSSRYGRLVRNAVTA